MAKEQLPKKSDNISEWYTSVIQLADLADYGPVKGTMIIKPYGYAIWEAIQKSLDYHIKQKGIGNAYFPLFIPMSFLEKEKKHVEGFSPELAVVTHAGGEKLEEPLVVRPTSETIIYDSYAKWVQSWRDLPLMMNQWCNIVRWEKRTMPFMRTSEFLWQEGHTAHATHEEAVEIQNWAMDAYTRVYREDLALDGYSGYKSISERFAGAETTLAFESLMPSGKVVQSCTSHDLGQNFSKVFEISFQNQQGDDEFAWQTSWGLSTRSIGALILAHGDDNGLCLPPKIAPTQVVIIPARITDEVVSYCETLRAELLGGNIRTLFDGGDNESFGFKLNKWEVKGVPIVLKVGPKEIVAETITCRRRDTLTDNQMDRKDAVNSIQKMLDDIQHDMLASSSRYRDENTRMAGDYEEFKALLKEHKGFIKVFWNDDAKVEKKIKDETKATSRCRLAEKSEGTDFYTGEPASDIWLFAQSY
jgi:prolyl-tRNA synthetase